MKYTKRTSLALALLLAGLSLTSCGQQANTSQLKTPAQTSAKTTAKTTAKPTAKTTEKTTATSQKASETKKTEAKKSEKKTEARKTEAKKTEAPKQAAQEKQNSWTPAEEEEPVRVQAPARTEAPAPARTQAPKPVQTEAPAPPPTEAPAPPPTEAPKPVIPEGYYEDRGHLVSYDPHTAKIFWFDDYGGEAAAEEACNAWMDEQPDEWYDGFKSVGYGTIIDYYTDRPAGWGVYRIPY